LPHSNEPQRETVLKRPTGKHRLYAGCKYSPHPYHRRSEFTLPLAVSPIIFPLLYYATHTTLRYRHPLDPIIVILATIAAAAPLQALANRLRPNPEKPR
jgi:hypothetical protein